MTPEERKRFNEMRMRIQESWNRPAPEPAADAPEDAPDALGDAMESLRAALDVRSKSDLLATARAVLGRVITNYEDLSSTQRRAAADATAAYLADLRAAGINGEGPGAVSTGPFNAIRPTSHER